jgi:hypothetical protein
LRARSRSVGGDLLVERRFRSELLQRLLLGIRGAADPLLERWVLV